MPSFDIVNKVDPQTLDNALNVARKEIVNRYDFRDSKTSIDLDKKTNEILIVTENSMKVNSIIDIIISRMSKQGLEAKCLDLSKEEYASGSMMKKEVKVRTGVDKEVARKIVKIIKDSKLKVTPTQMDDMVRVSGKKIDDLQSVIQLLRRESFEVPLQFVNMKS
ncbi:MAG: YajQ family cyclic di-GMP-binding protein [Cytophagaceae bacterium]|nr:YajQ family cyclic di-GMP-binding protein [Cytophagaceae bacterium]